MINSVNFLFDDPILLGASIILSVSMIILFWALKTYRDLVIPSQKPSSEISNLSQESSQKSPVEEMSSSPQESSVEEILSPSQDSPQESSQKSPVEEISSSPQESSVELKTESSGENEKITKDLRDIYIKLEGIQTAIDELKRLVSDSNKNINNNNHFNL